jgi:putative ABC transport system permease protein
MRTGFRKVIRDLWGSKGRTLLVVASIAAGVLALGMIQSTNAMVTGRMTEAHAASQPSHVLLFLNGLADDAIVASITRIPGIRQAQGRATFGVRWKPTLESDWSTANLVAVKDYDAQLLNLIELHDGSWPGTRSVALAGVHQAPFGFPDLGGTIYLELNDRPRPFQVRGIVRDPLVSSPPFEENPSLYVSLPLIERLGAYPGYSQLHFDLKEFSQQRAELALDLVEEKLEQVGISVGFSIINDPARHWAQDVMDGVGLVLSVMAVASLFLSVILVINTINAVITQQIPQIGIMKTVGAVSSQITPLYLSGVLVYGGMSLLIAVPLGAVAGQLLSRWMLALINVPAGSFGLETGTLLLQLGAGLIVPLLAALWPVLRGVSISVSQAISAYGLGSGQYGRGVIDRLISNLRGLPRMAILSIRNTFRRAGRAVLTEAVLVTSGAIFMMVISTNYSFNETIADVWRGLGFDALIVFRGPQRIEEMVPLLEQRPNVKQVEMWTWVIGQAQLPNEGRDAEDHRIALRGIPHETDMFQPKLIAGRELAPGDGHALLLNQKVAQEMGASVGDAIAIDLPNGRSTTWTIVGLVIDITGNQETAYVHRDLLNRDLNILGRSYVAEIKAMDDSPAAQYALVKDMREHLESVGVPITYARTATEDRELAEGQFSILTTVLMTVTVLMAVVGSIGLSGTLSINVIERRREIGVMRAVGASSRDVALVFMGEGLLLGLLSWAVAVPLGLIAGKPFVLSIGELIDFPGQYSPAVQGLWIWLGIVLVLSMLASWVPARKATQISVSQSLAYE